VTKEEIVEQLENYRNNKAMVKIKRIEIENYTPISEEESIEQLILKGFQGERVMTSNIADFTGKVALKYKDFSKTSSVRVLSDIIQEINEIEIGLIMLETAVRLLNPKAKAVITEIYFNNKPVTEVSSYLDITRKTVWRHKNRAINELYKICNRLSKYKYF